ncbi:MAG: hypothetical protein ABSC17_09785 [Thermacetogeniaceae bacterium]
MDDLGDEPRYELSEFEIKINELIQGEVKERLGQAAIDLENYKTDNAQLQKRNHELSSNLRKIETDHKAALTKALRDKEIEVKREIFGGFVIGDTGYFAESEIILHTCEKCKGKGKINVQIAEEEKIVRCPYCDGNKSTHTYHFTPKQSKIYFIKVELQENKKWLKFALKGSNDCHEYTSNDIYKTLEECQAVCDEKNK